MNTATRSSSLPQSAVDVPFKGGWAGWRAGIGSFLRSSNPKSRAPTRTRISFDVDDTLVCHGALVRSEDSPIPACIRRWLGEPLRLGTCALVRELRRRECSVWIYTTSGRSPFYIRRWLLLHGIRIDGVVNSERHRQGLAVHGFSRLPSKFPPAFGIDLHVDDSDGVRMEGDAHGFRVVVVSPDDEQWTRRVLDAVAHAQAA